MYTKDIYDKVIKVIEEEIPLPDGWLHGRETEDATDARSFLGGRQGLGHLHRSRAHRRNLPEIISL